MCSCLRLILLPVACMLASAAPAFLQEVPSDLHPPAGERELFAAHAKGDQIYTCKSTGNQYAWTLKGPDAKLINEQGQPIARHYAGPTWEANDHSAVIGKVVASAAPPDRKSIPWLLLSAVNHSGSGMMTAVLSIQRLNTNGGAAPASGCDAADAGAQTRASYTADYHFYGKTK
jgi:Protein of unknown function (DUF3455)